MYVPESLVPLFEKALKNGRQLEALLYEQGPGVLKEFRRQRGRTEKTSAPTKKTQAPNIKAKQTRILKKTRPKS